MTNYTITKKAPVTIIGISCRTSNDPEAGPKDIPALWERFYREEIAAKIPNKASEEVLALYCDYEGDHTKPYSVIIACPVTSLDIVPEGMVAKTIPESSYATFPVTGEFPQSLIETWEHIWQTDLARTFSGDFELYGEKFNLSGAQELEVYIAIDEAQKNT